MVFVKFESPDNFVFNVWNWLSVTKRTILNIVWRRYISSIIRIVLYIIFEKLSLCSLPFCSLPSDYFTLLSALCSLPTAPCPLLSALCSLPSAPCPLLPALCSLLPCPLLPALRSLPSAPCSLLSALCSLPSAPCPLFPALWSLFNTISWLFLTFYLWKMM